MAFLDETSFEIRLLADHRDDLVAERTRHQNRLRWRLVELDPDLEAKLPVRALDRECWIERVARRLAKLPQTARVRVARDELRRIREHMRAERELKAAIAVLQPDVLAEDGIGTITAATLIGHTAGAARFPDRRTLRPPGGRRADARLLRTHHTRQAQPRRRQPAQLRALPHRGDPRSHLPHTRACLDHKIAEGKPTPRPTAVSNVTSPAAPGTYSPAHPTPGPLDHDHSLQHANHRVGLDK